MKIEFTQKEENGVYTVSLKGTIEDKGIAFGNEHKLEPPYTKSQMDNTISNCIQDFIDRYDVEMGRG